MVCIFHNINIKQHLLTLFVTFLYADGFAHSSPLSIQHSKVTKVFECNHEEDDARMIFHAL